MLAQQNVRSLKGFLNAINKDCVNDHTYDKSGLKRTVTLETQDSAEEVPTSKKPKKRKVKVEELEVKSEIHKKQSPQNTSSVSTTESETWSKKKSKKK